MLCTILDAWDITTHKSGKKSLVSWHLHCTREQKIMNRKLNKYVNYVISWKEIRTMLKKKKKRCRVSDIGSICGEFQAEILN